MHLSPGNRVDNIQIFFRIFFFEKIFFKYFFNEYSNIFRIFFVGIGANSLQNVSQIFLDFYFMTLMKNPTTFASNKTFVAIARFSKI
jgi:hypothetical protein